MTLRSCVFILLVLTARLSNAQVTSLVSQNPFRNVQFTNSATDTITIAADFANVIGELTTSQRDIFSVISQQSKINVGDFKYAIGFKIQGYEQSFYAPCKDVGMYKLLSERKNGTTKLKLRCVVFRFYHADLTTNFFYVEKVSL
ncbi:MAG: hypothetical protein ACXVAY_15295 [Mucilaginibacter sp.]